MKSTLVTMTLKTLHFDQLRMEKPTLPLALALSTTSTPILTRTKFLIDTGNTLFAIISKETYLKLGKPKLKKQGVKVRTGNGITVLPIFIFKSVFSKNYFLIFVESCFWFY